MVLHTGSGHPQGATPPPFFVGRTYDSDRLPASSQGSLGQECPSHPPRIFPDSISRGAAGTRGFPLCLTPGLPSQRPRRLAQLVPVLVQLRARPSSRAHAWCPGANWYSAPLRTLGPRRCLPRVCHESHNSLGRSVDTTYGNVACMLSGSSSGLPFCRLGGLPSSACGGSQEIPAPSPGAASWEIMVLTLYPIE